MTPTPSKIVLRWAFWLFFLSREKSKLFAWLLVRFFCCSLKSYFKNKLFWEVPPSILSHVAQHTHAKKIPFYLGFLVVIHIFILFQFWGQYLFSTLSYGFFKSHTLLHRCSGPKSTEKQDLLFTKITLTYKLATVHGSLILSKYTLTVSAWRHGDEHFFRRFKYHVWTFHEKIIFATVHFWEMSGYVRTCAFPS